MNDEPLDDQITVLDYSSMLYDVRKQRNELRDEFNIVIKQLEDMQHERDKYKKLWLHAVDHQNRTAEEKTIEYLYWKIRAVLVTSQITLQSPHPLWSELNELMETMPTLEKLLGIVNRWESIEVKP